MNFLDRLNNRLQNIFGTKLFMEADNDSERLLDFLQGQKWQTPNGSNTRLSSKAADYFRQRDMSTAEILNALRDHNMLSDTQVQSLSERFGPSPTGSADYKNPNSPNYNRQKAENALYHTIGPLTDSPRWVDAPWSSPGEPVPGFNPGGPAPKWTNDEVVMAMAGDPNLLFRANDNPRSPGYGVRGGSPIFRIAKQLARQFNIPNDKSQIEDMYQNGLVQLITMMQPGYDEGRSPFVSYVYRPIKGAMQYGIGGSRQAIDATKGESEKSDIIGMGAVMQSNDPKFVRSAANQVRGKYRTERSHAKDPDNPFGPYSKAYYETAMNYADALESGDEDRIEAAKNQMRQFIDTVEQESTPIRSVGTGLGQAVSNVDRRTAVGVQSMDVATDDGSTMAGNVTMDDGEDSFVDPETVHYILDIAINYDLGKILKSSKKYQQMASDIFYREKDTKYLKALADYEEYQRELQQYKEQVDSLSPEVQQLEQEKAELIAAGQEDEAEKIKIPELPQPPKPVQPPKEVVKNRKISIGGPMTANELRHITRALGPLGSNYPGRGTMRTNLDIPRDAKGWWQPGEDPEIEPIPSGGIWHSIWSRNDYPSMAGKPSAIADEFTAEVYEFNELGIESARSQKVADTGTAMSKVSVNTTFQNAKIKFEIIKDIHRHELGLDESILKQLPILEDVPSIDKHIIAETCDWIIRKIELMEKSPPGWKGSVKAMKKHTDTFSTDDESKINPYALAWSMHKKGAKPHYKDIEGKPEKKKEYSNEGMQPVDSIDFD